MVRIAGPDFTGMALNQIRRLFGLKRLNEGIRIVVNCEKLENRVALLENGSVEEYGVERVDSENLVGSIYKGKVKNIEQGLKAMFVDIGLEKNAFLHFWDAIPEALDAGMEEIRRPSSPKKKQKITAKDIPDLYPVGSEILVQVTKGAIGNKGPRITTNVSLAGRFMVLMPRNDQFGISRKIEDPKERARLRKLMEQLQIPEGMGVILRTVSQGQRLRYLVRDLNLLLEQWDQIEDNRDAMKAPACVFREPNIIERTVRDFLTDEVEEVIIDNEAVTERMKDMVGAISRRSRNRITFHSSQEPIFEKFGIQKQIDDAFYRQVWLPCGGYLVIDETEALISVDVNTGRNKGAGDKMILETNLEAAAEVARQLRLRNIGGLIVVDFIDMRSRKDQAAVYKVIKDRLKRDKAKTQVLPISPLGLLEMTRQRLSESLSVTVSEPCSYCNGRGVVKSTTTMSVELQRKINALMYRKHITARSLLIIVHPEVLHRLKTEDSALLVELERRHEARFTFRSDPSFHREQLSICNAESGEELKL